jgi:hypothetical protein
MCIEDVVLNKNGQAWPIDWVNLLGEGLFGYTRAVHWSQDG